VTVKIGALTERAVRLLDEHPGLQFIAALTIIIVLKWHALWEPPIWDAAMGLFPAALTLAERNFNLWELLAMPAYLQGGPNTHSTSVVTLVTAMVLKLTGEGPNGFLALHLMHFAIAAWTFVVLFGFVRPTIGSASSALLCLATLLFPIVLTQVGYMYLEIPLLLCTVSALRAWLNQRFWPAVLWAAAAVSIKEIGIIVPGTLCIATLIEHRTAGARLARAALIALPPAMVLGATLLLQYLATSAWGHPTQPVSIGRAFLAVLHYLNRFIMNVPDLWALIVAFVAAVPLLGRPVLETMRHEPAPPGGRSADAGLRLIVGLGGILILVFILMFTVVLPAWYRYPFLLPRYGVVIAPFLLLSFGYALHQLVGTRHPNVMRASFAVACVFFAVNTNGAFYPKDVDTEGPGNDPALTERSGAYRRLLGVQVQAIRALEALPPSVPVYYGHYEHYLLNYPGLGYASGPLPNGRNLYLEPLKEVLLRDSQAPCTYALYSYAWLGGDQILSLIEKADTQDGLSSEVVQEFRDGPYVMKLIRFRKDEAVCPR